MFLIVHKKISTLVNPTVLKESSMIANENMTDLLGNTSDGITIPEQRALLRILKPTNSNLLDLARIRRREVRT